MESVYIALGSNLHQPKIQLDTAVKFIQRLPRSNFVAVSPYYCTDPVGPVGQKAYLNAVARIESRLPPLELLYRMQRQENRQLRKRGVHWGPRTLDLDLLLYGQRVIRHRDLEVPHYAMTIRDFVLMPLLDVAPKTLNIPGYGPLDRLASERSLGQD